MICAECGQPVHEGPRGVWSHDTYEAWSACPARGDSAKVKSGSNEK